MFATVGTTYTILKGLSGLPDIADGLTKLKNMLKKEFTDLATRKVRDQLIQSSKNKALPHLHRIQSCRTLLSMPDPFSHLLQAK